MLKILPINTMKLIYFTFVTLLLLCSQKIMAQAPEIKKSEVSKDYLVEPFVKTDGIPWGMDWLPSGDMLVTMRDGQLKLIREGNIIHHEINGLPEIAVGRQGGLLDIKVHPDYTNKPWIYFSYARSDGKGNKSTAIMRAQLKNDTLVNQQDIYIAQAYGDKGVHFGSRIEFDNQGYLYFSIGDRGNRDINPQDLSRDGGKIYRLHDDGSIPEDNPFVNSKNAKTAVFSYGHRNPQGMVKEPQTGNILTHEHGPKGGDELNLIKPGKNYGWPVISYGVNYSGTKFTELTEKQGMEKPLWYWVPSIAPSGMTFITSDKYPQWQGKLALGSLKFGFISILTLESGQVTGEEKAFEGLLRVRNIEQGPDGYLYVGVDGKGIYRIEPK
jgi:glucose/arabinose dehydrogenase